MGSPIGYALVATAFLANLPFGGWRSFQRRLSWQWFLAIHLPIPLIFILRTGFGYSAWFIPWLLIGAVLGQLSGGWAIAEIRRRRAARRPCQSD